MQKDIIPFLAPYPWLKLIKLHETSKLNQEQLSGQLLIWGQILYEELMACQRDTGYCKLVDSAITLVL